MTDTTPTPTNQGRVEALARAFTAEQLDVLQRAVDGYRGLLSILPGDIPELQTTIELLGDVQPVLAAAHQMASNPQAPPPVVPHACTNCRATMRKCDMKMIATGRPCCGACANYGTHGDDDLDATVERMRQLRASLAAEVARG